MVEQQIQCHPLLLVINVRKQPLLGMSLRLVQSGHFGRKPLASNPSRQDWLPFRALLHVNKPFLQRPDFRHPYDLLLTPDSVHLQFLLCAARGIS